MMARGPRNARICATKRDWSVEAQVPYDGVKIQNPCHDSSFLSSKEIAEKSRSPKSEKKAGNEDCSKSSNWELAVGTSASSRDDDIKRETDGRGTALPSTDPDAWNPEGHTRICATKRDWSVEAQVPKETRYDVVKIQNPCDDSSFRSSNEIAENSRSPKSEKKAGNEDCSKNSNWELAVGSSASSRDDDIKRETDGCGTALPSTGPDAWNCEGHARICATKRDWSVDAQVPKEIRYGGVKIQNPCHDSSIWSSKEIAEKSRSPRWSEKQAGNEDCSKISNWELAVGSSASSRDDDIKRETDDCGTALPSTGPDTWNIEGHARICATKRDCSVEAQVSKEIRYDGVKIQNPCDDSSFRSSKEIAEKSRSPKSEKKAGNEDCSKSSNWELAVGSSASSRDDDIKRETDGWGTTLPSTGPDAWNRDSRNKVGNGNKENIRWSAAPEKTNPGTGIGSDSWERDRKYGNPNRETGVWKHQERDGNVGGDIDRRVTNLDRTAIDEWKHRKKDDNVESKTWQYHKAHGERCPDACKQQTRDGNVKRETDAWGAAWKQSGPDPSRSHTRDGNVNKETDGWGAVIDHHCSRDGDVKKEDESRSDPWNHHIRGGNVKRGPDARGDARNKAVPDSWEHHSRDASRRRETYGSGATSDHRHSNDQAGHAPQRQQRVDGTFKKETDGCAKALHRTGREPWRPQSGDYNVKRETSGWSYAHERTDRNPMKCHRTDGNSRNKTSGCKTLDQNGTDACKLNGGDNNVSRETPDRLTAREIINHDSWNYQSRVTNLNRRIVGWDRTLGQSGPDASNHQKDFIYANKQADGREINRETNGWGEWESNTKDSNANQAGSNARGAHHSNHGNLDKKADERDIVLEQTAHDVWNCDGKSVKQVCADPWECFSKDANVIRETNGWGEWECSSKDGRAKQAGSSAWEHHNKDGNLDKKSDQQDLALDQTTRDARDCDDTGLKQICHDPWESLSRDGNAIRETKTDGWGTALDQTGPDAWNRHNRFGNGRLEADGCGKSLDHDGSDPWKRHTTDVNVKKITDGLGKVRDQTNPNPRKRKIRDGNTKRESAWDRRSTDFYSKKETYGRVKAVDQTCLGQWKGCHGDGNRKKDVDHWGKSLDMTGIRENKTRHSSWNNTYRGRSQSPVGLSDARDRRSNNFYSKNETYGQVKAVDQTCLDQWKGCHRDGNRKRDVDDRRKSLDLTGIHENRTRHGSWNNAYRGRSQSPVGLKRASEACKYFAAEDCRIGRQCGFLHEEDNGLSHFGTRRSEIKDTRQGNYRNKGLPNSANDQNDYPRARGFQSSRDQSLHNGERTYEANSSEVRHVPHRYTAADASDDGSLIKDQSSKERTIDKTDAEQAMEPRGSTGASCFCSSNDNFSHHGESRVPSDCRVHASLLDHNQESNTRSSWDRSKSADQTMKTNEESSTVVDTCSFGLQDSTHKPQSLQDQRCNSELNVGTDKKQHNGNLEPQKVEMNGAKEVSDAETAQNKKEQTLRDHNLRKFKIELAEFIKEIIKPAWKEGHLTKEAHILVVKKAVDKVIAVLPDNIIPQTQDDINLYLTCSKEKLNNLAKAYLDMYMVKNTTDVDSKV